MQATHFSVLDLLRISRLLTVCLAISMAGSAIWLTAACADEAVDTVALARDVDKSLRAAERDMFNGKNESADQQLEQIAPRIEQLKTSDPDNSKLKTLESKYAKIRKDLDRKLGRNTSTSGSSGPAAPASPAAAPVPAVAPVAAAVPASSQPELPRAIQSDLANATTKLDEAESKWLEDSSGGRTVSGSTDPNQVKLEAVEKPLKSASYYYGNILKKCERQSSPCDPNHPQIASLNTRIESMQANVAGLNAEIEKSAAAGAAAAAAAAEQAQASEADCASWDQKLQVYTEGDKALYRCVSGSDEDMPACKSAYEEAVALKAELKETPWAEEPCGALNSTLSDLDRYMENFKPRYERYADEQAAAKANKGEIVFSKQAIDPLNPARLTGQFDAGDTIYGLIQTTRPWSEIYQNANSADVMVNVSVDGEKIHAQFVKLNNSELLAQQFLIFEIAPDPGKMTAYSNPDKQYGASSATMRQGPNELTHHLAQLGPGQHTLKFEVSYYGTVWSAGSLIITGDDFQSYAKMHELIAEKVYQSVTLPVARMTNKSMAAEMESLLENAGWDDIHRINIVDKDWWIDRISGGDSAVKSRHLAAAALAEDDDGYYYKVCTFHQDRLLTGGFGELYLSHQGDRVAIPKANIDQ